MSALLAIDPGLKGAITTFLDGKLHGVADIPVKEGQLDAFGLLLDLRAWRPSSIWLEAVGPRPTDGAVAAFTFGEVYGGIRAVIEWYRNERLSEASHFVRLNLVTPSTWTRSLGLAHTDKQARKALCKATWPAMAKAFKRGDHADAALIGSYGVAQEGQRNAT